MEVQEEGGRQKENNGPGTSRTAPGGRRSLLDTTRAPVASATPSSPTPTITITVSATTKGFYAPGLGPPAHLPVAITVQPLRFGGLMPADCGPAIAAVGALVVGVALVAPWWPEDGVRVVGGWLDGEGEEREGEEREGGQWKAR